MAVNNEGVCVGYDGLLPVYCLPTHTDTDNDRDANLLAPAAATGISIPWRMRHSALISWALGASATRRPPRNE